MPGSNLENQLQRKTRMSPKEAQFLLNEMTYMLTVDEEIHNEWKTLYDQKPEKADMVLNNNKIEMNGKENFLDYANLFEQRKDKSFEEANYEHNTIHDSEKVSYARHKANNIKDPLTLMVTFFELPQETQDKMPRLKEYMKKRAPLMESLVHANTTTDFAAHSSLTELTPSLYNSRGKNVFDSSVLYNSNDGVINNPRGLERCDMTKELGKYEKNEINGKYRLGGIEESAGITDEAVKEELLSEFEKAASSNNFRSEKVRGELDASAAEIRGIATEGTYKRAWDNMPKTKWWHRSPDPNSAITKVQEAVGELDTAMNSLDNDLSAENRAAAEQKLRETIEAAERYLNEKDAQKGISTELSPEERLAQNNVRTGFGQQRYQAVYDIRRDCMAKLESLQRASRNYNALSTQLEETVSIEEKENKYFNEIENHNADIYRKIDSLTAERDELKAQLDELSKTTKELRKDAEDYQRFSNVIKETINTARDVYIYNQCKNKPDYQKLAFDIDQLNSAERKFREDAQSDKTVTPKQFNEQIKAYDDARKMAKAEMKIIVDDAMKKYQESGQKEKDEMKAREDAKKTYLYGHGDRDKYSARFDEIMKGNSQQRLQQFESEVYPTRERLNSINADINDLSKKIKDVKYTSDMWKEHDQKYMAQKKENRVSVSHDVINEINNRNSVNNNHVHRSHNSKQKERVNQM